MGKLAIDGGLPVRKQALPYGRQWVTDDDIAAVDKVLRSDWLTTGPTVREFEKAFAEKVGAREAVAISNGTAALHAMTFALGIKPGDEVIVPAMTFAASSNCVLYQGGTPVFADVEPDTLLIDPESAEKRITGRTRAILAVDYAGQPCNYDRLRAVGEKHGIPVLSDACHALGAVYNGKPVGTLGLLNAFSLHPVKHITTGEGGMITTEDEGFAQRMRVFRNHGITSDHREREHLGSWVYEMTDLGYNYRLSDIQCALGISQLKRLDGWLMRRREIAAAYNRAFSAASAVSPLAVRPGVAHAYHLYVVRLDLSKLRVDRKAVFAALRAEGIGVNVHYIPVHYHPFYRENLGLQKGLCPQAESAYEEIISLPMFPHMSDQDVADVIEAVNKVVEAYRY